MFLSNQLDVLSRDIRDDFHQQLVEIETNHALELQTVQDSLEAKGNER